MVTKKILLLVLIASIFAIAWAGSGPIGCTSPTVIDGYPFYSNGTTVSGTNVTVTTTGSSCNSHSDISDPSGYYSIPGMSIQGETSTATAAIGIFTGVNSSFSSSSVLHLNIYIRPTPPTLTPVPDRHNGTNVQLNWTSGIEPASGVIKFDQINIDGAGFVNATSPLLKNFTTYATHTWEVRTCNPAVCSVATSDSFLVFNTQPTTPTLPDLNFTDQSSITLSWNSGADSDVGPIDSLADEFQFSNTSDFSTIINTTNISTTGLASHSITIFGLPSLQQFYWRVRTCDDTTASNRCSNFASDNFFTFSCPAAPAPAACPAGGGGGGGGGVGAAVLVAPSYIISFTTPAELSQGDNLVVLVNFKSAQNVGEAEFQITTPSGITAEPSRLTNYSANTEREVLVKGRVGDKMQLGQYPLVLSVIVSNKVVASKMFRLSIRSKTAAGVCGDGVCGLAESADTCLQDCHCGNNLCEGEFGEDTLTCAFDCPILPAFVKVVPFSAFVFWILILLIAMLLILVHEIRKHLKIKREGARPKPAAVEKKPAKPAPKPGPRLRSFE